MLSGWDIHDTVYPNELSIANRKNGYRDLLAEVDLATYRRIPWEGNVPFFFVSFLDPEIQEPIAPCPRGTLSKVMKMAAESGWTCLSGVEFEVRVEPICIRPLPTLVLRKSTSNSKVCWM
jgi:glutamine synthetase